MGPVPQLWLKVCHYQDGEEGAKGLVTSFFHLLDLEGEKEGLKQSPSQAPGSRPLQTHLEGRSATPVPTCVPRSHSQPLQPQRQTAQRPASATQRSPADSVPRGRAVRARRVRAAAYPCLEARQWQCASAVTSEATQGGEGSGGGTAAGGKDKKGGDTCDTVQRDGGGGTGYPSR